MWNSPNKWSDRGVRYSMEDISALILPLDYLLDSVKALPVERVVVEPILERLDADEFVYALYQVFQALLEEVEIPRGGHTGIQEAIIPELLSQSAGLIAGEVEEPHGSFRMREMVWGNVDRFVIQPCLGEGVVPFVLEQAGVSLEEPAPYRSSRMTAMVWEELLTGEDYLVGEFLWDSDWRLDMVLDLPPDQAGEFGELAGMNLKVVHALADTPSEEELEVAERYLYSVIRKHEAMCCGGQRIS